MTKLDGEKPVVRETAALERGRAIVVELHPRYLRLRLKGLHGGVNVDYESVLALARKLAWRRDGR